MDKEEHEGRITENILYFSRLLRAAGLPVGSREVLDATKALALVGISSREDLYWLLFSNFVSRSDHRELFDQAFHIFWKNPRIMERMAGLMLPVMRVEEDDSQQISKRISDAVAPGVEPTKGAEGEETKLEFDASFTFADSEVLQDKDFEQMSSREIEEAKKDIKDLKLNISSVRSRRYRP